MGKTEDIKKLRESGNILFEYIRGSHCHGIATATSDVDTGGVYAAPLETILGLRSNYEKAEQVSDDKNDTTFYELGRWIELLLKSNPTALEGLFVDDKYIITMSPEIKWIREHRDSFLSKDCFNALIGYSVAQVKRATGLNKKCMMPDNMTRQEILDFCFVAGDNEDTIPFKKWLKDHNMLQKYCGLAKRTNMPGCYSVFYDFGSHYKYEDDVAEGFNLKNDIPINLGYKGVVDPNGESNDLRLSSIPKGQKAVCTLYYNQNSYEMHCKEYNEWSHWRTLRNEERYESNKDFTYDAKNMCECIRLVHTGIELARDGMMNIERTWDRDFLLDVKHHKYSYEFIMDYIKEKQEEFKKYEKTSTLPEHINADFVNSLLIAMRKKIYNI